VGVVTGFYTMTNTGESLDCEEISSQWDHSSHSLRDEEKVREDIWKATGEISV
jgi:hypothetical protein